MHSGDPNRKKVQKEWNICMCVTDSPTVQPKLQNTEKQLFLFSCVWLFETPWTAACQASLSSTLSQSWLRLMSIESVMPSNHLILCCPLLLLPSIFLSIRVFFNESDLCIRWPKYWSFSFSISLSNEYSGLISLRTDCFDLHAVQGTFNHPDGKHQFISAQPSLWSNLDICTWLLEKL